MLDQLWGKLGSGNAIVTLARSRKLDARSVERALSRGGLTGVGALLEVGSDGAGPR